MSTTIAHADHGVTTTNVALLTTSIVDRTINLPQSPRTTLNDWAVGDAKLTLSRIESHNIKVQSSIVTLIRSWATANSNYPNSKTIPAVRAIGEAVQIEINRRKDRAVAEAKPGLKPMVISRKKK